jgi:hypothetical protein
MFPFHPLDPSTPTVMIRPTQRLRDTTKTTPWTRTNPSKCLVRAPPRPPESSPCPATPVPSKGSRLLPGNVLPCRHEYGTIHPVSDSAGQESHVRRRDSRRPSINRQVRTQIVYTSLDFLDFRLLLSFALFLMLPNCAFSTLSSTNQQTRLLSHRSIIHDTSLHTI